MGGVYPPGCVREMETFWKPPPTAWNVVNAFRLFGPPVMFTGEVAVPSELLLLVTITLT